MSHLQYYAYPGAGEHQTRTVGYSQAVRVGDIIDCAGQGGWNDKIEIPDSLEEEIAQAFENVRSNIKSAGGNGWDQVYKVRSYHIPLNDNTLDIMVKNLKKYCPNHQPIWTCVGVTTLGLQKMRVEIDVTAHIPK